MNRESFIKQLGLSGAGFLMPKSGIFHGNLLSQPVKIYDNYLRGNEHYHINQCFPKMLVGDTLELKREPENPYDKFAIQVFWESHKLGYIPAYENVVLANLIDAGVQLKSLLTQKLTEDAVSVGVWADLITTGEPRPDPLTEQSADEIDDNYRNYRRPREWL